MQYIEYIQRIQYIEYIQRIQYIEYIQRIQYCRPLLYIVGDSTTGACSWSALWYTLMGLQHMAEHQRCYE